MVKKSRSVPVPSAREDARWWLAPARGVLIGHAVACRITIEPRATIGVRGTRIEIAAAGARIVCAEQRVLITVARAAIAVTCARQAVGEAGSRAKTSIAISRAAFAVRSTGEAERHADEIFAAPAYWVAEARAAILIVRADDGIGATVRTALRDWVAESGAAIGVSTTANANGFAVGAQAPFTTTATAVAIHCANDTAGYTRLSPTDAITVANALTAFAVAEALVSIHQTSRALQRDRVADA